MVEPSTPASLYEALGAAVPVSAPKGETVSTKAKETIDNDVEALSIEEMAQGVC